MNFTKKVEVRWSDLDPNFHLRHSVYYDWGAYVRMSYLNEMGLTTYVMKEQKIGLIIFREEAVFKKEIHFNDTIFLNVIITKATKNFARWTMQHEVFKNDNQLSAIITIDGAWIDTEKRKLAIPPDVITKNFGKIAKADSFIWVD